jgi:hypothetical protein
VKLYLRSLKRLGVIRCSQALKAFIVDGTEKVSGAFMVGLTDEETIMKLKTIALAGALALSSTLAFAQGGGNAASSAAMPENSGAATNAQGGVVGNTTDGKTTLNNGTTTGETMKKNDSTSNSSMSKDGMKNDSMNRGGLTK